MKKFLVTGANGQVGRCLVERLKDKADLLALTKDHLDITNKQEVFNIVQQFKPDVIINAAAYTAVDRAETEIALAKAINIDGAKNLAEAAQIVNAIILHISTDYVFDGKLDRPYVESDAVNPQGVYGETKLMGEQEVLLVNPRSIILRTAWVFAEHGHNFVKTMLRLGNERESISIVNDQFGSPTYAGDIADALIKISYIVLNNNELFGIYHYTGFPYVSWYDFAEEIFRQAKLQNILHHIPLLKAISSSEYPTPAKRPINSRLNLNKIQQIFNIQPSDWRQKINKLNDYWDMENN